MGMFCPKCKKLMKMDPTTKTLKCQRCADLDAQKVPDIPLKVDACQAKELYVSDPANTYIGEKTTDFYCENCGNKEAYVYQRQTRRADEPPTEFKTCTKCSKVYKR